MNAARQGGRCLQAADGPSRSARGAAHRGPRATDALTGIPNRGAFERTLRRHLRDAQAGRSFVLALVDLDDFKRVFLKEFDGTVYVKEDALLTFLIGFPRM